MTSHNRPTPTTPSKTPGTTPFYIYYVVGALLIAFTLLNASSLGNPVIVVAIVLGVSAGLYFISTPQGKAFVTKHSQRHIDEQSKSASTVLSQDTLLQELSVKNLLAQNEKVVFNQWATYQGGVSGHPNVATSYGMAVVLDQAFVFYDKQMSVKILYVNLLEAKLENFQVDAIRGMLASGAVALQLQQTKNILSLRYKDKQGLERNAKFRINGAITIPGEADRAREFLNYLLEFQGKFAPNFVESDPIAKLEKLKVLKEKGVISEAEFQKKKSKLLDQI